MRRPDRAAPVGLTPLCWVIKPKTAIRCLKIGLDHDGDHANDYTGRGRGGTTWPRSKYDRR